MIFNTSFFNLLLVLLYKWSCRGLCVWSFHYFPCACMDSPSTPASSQSKDMLVRLMSYSTLGIGMNGCLFLCVSAVRVWWPFHSVSQLSPFDSWDNAHPSFGWDKQKRTDGWMAGGMDGKPHKDCFCVFKSFSVLKWKANESKYQRKLNPRHFGSVVGWLEVTLNGRQTDEVYQTHIWIYMWL